MCIFPFYQKPAVSWVMRGILKCGQNLDFLTALIFYQIGITDYSSSILAIAPLIVKQTSVEIT